MTQNKPHVQAVTVGPQHHFFGYYDKSPWDPTGRWLLALQSRFWGRPPTAEDMALIGTIDTQNDNRWTPVAETRAWNWQQGCMLQWLGNENKIIFNDRCDNQYVARILDLSDGHERTLDRPIYTVSRNGLSAVSLNFSRLHHQRPGYGYVGISDPWETEKAPQNDGIYTMDLSTGTSRLLISLADIVNVKPSPHFAASIHRFNHAQIRPDGQRFAFFHRYRENERGITRMFTVNFDGSALYALSDHGMVSHYDWRTNDEIVAWAHHPDLGTHYLRMQDQTQECRILGEEVFHSDGHCSFSPTDRSWMLTDTYPREDHCRALMLFHLPTEHRIDLGRFYSSPECAGESRCDLHPRWSRDGRQVCFDSTHEGSRQIYTLDVSEIVDG